MHEVWTQRPIRKRDQLLDGRNFCVMLAAGVFVLGVSLIIWSKSVMLGSSGAGWGSGAVTIVREDKGGLQVDMSLPPSLPMTGKVRFAESYLSATGPRFFGDLMEEWRIDWMYQPESPSGTLSEKEQAQAIAAARAFRFAQESRRLHYAPEFLDLLKSGDSFKKSLREGAILAAATRVSGVLCILASLGLAAWACVWMQRVRRMDLGFCGDCGYDLRSNAGAVCPECGRKIST